MTSYIDNIKTKYIIDIDTILYPQIDKKIEYGIFYPGGAGGSFLTSCLLEKLEKNDNYRLNSTSNEYHITNYQFWSHTDFFVFRDHQMSNEDFLKLLENEFRCIMQYSTYICAGHWLPLILISQSNIKIKHLLYIKYGQWMPRVLTDIKRKGLSSVFLNTISLEQIINDYNRSTQINENYSLNYIKMANLPSNKHRQINTIEVKEYDQLFFDLDCDLPISKKKIAEYSFRNLELIEKIADRTMNNTSLKEEFKHNVLNDYKNRLNKAVKCLNV